MFKMLLRFIALIIGMPFLGFSLAITIMLIKTGIHYEQKEVPDPYDYLDSDYEEYLRKENSNEPHKNR